MDYEIEVKKILSESAHVEVPFVSKYKAPTYPKTIDEYELSDARKLPQSPLVSVLILAYNKSEYIRECVASILSQKTDFDFEIVIAEDCSTDATRDIVISMQQEHPDKIRVIYANANVGVMRNTLRGLRFCKGEYVAHIDGDDYCATDTKLQRQVDVFKSERDVSLIYTGGYVQLEKMKFLKVPFAYQTRRRLVGYNQLPNDEFAKMELLNNPITASSVMMRSDAARFAAERIERLFECTEWFPCQDFELWFYCANKGKCYYLDELSIVYRHNKGAVTAANDKVSSARCLGDCRNAIAIACQEGLFKDEGFAKKIVGKFINLYRRYAMIAGIDDKQDAILLRYKDAANVRANDKRPSKIRDLLKACLGRNYISYMVKSIAIRIFRV